MAERPRKKTVTTEPKRSTPKPAPRADTKEPKPAAPRPAATEVCPRCGTEKFGPEERTRIEGRRTVRYTVLVCERGHTFAKAASTKPKT